MNIQELKHIKQIIQDNYNISASEAARVVGYINTNNSTIIQDILSGDCSGVPSVLADLNIKAAGSAEKTTKKARRESDPIKNNLGTAEKKTVKQSAARGLIQGDIIKDNTSDIIQPSAALSGSLGASDSLSDKIPADYIKPVTSQKHADILTENFDTRKENNADILPAENIQDVLPAVDGDIVPADDLPAGFADTVREWFESWAQFEKIDLLKLHAQQWRAACMYIGSKVKQSHVLDDVEKIKNRGGRFYSGQKLEALLSLWAYFCGKYKQVPLVFDFVSFSGVSKTYFYDYDGKGLSSTSVNILQKAKRIEESGLGSSVAGGGAGTVGGIFLLKTRHGYSETVTIQHTSSAASVGVGDLPLLGQNVDSIPLKSN